MKVLVTGHQGYIGAHLVEVLQAAGHFVTGVDLALFGQCSWSPLPKPDRELRKDIRALTEADVAGHDCVMHLAALSNDPLGKLDEHLTYSINRDASIRLARLSKACGVPRFLFAASCAVYGKRGSEELDESAALDPVSAYAHSKVDAERAIAALADESFTPVFLRNATAYGASPMLRLDLVANNLLASAFTLGKIRIMSDGMPWRPLVHCRDIARAFAAFLTAPRADVHNLAVNIGSNDANYQVRDIAKAVQTLIPAAEIQYTGEVGPDPRSYRVNFDLLKRILPDFHMDYHLQTGLDELYKQFVDKHLSQDDFHGTKYYRIRSIKNTFYLIDKSFDIH